MLIKLIQCRVSRQDRARFASGQAQWVALAGCKGFGGQLGGWADDDRDLAVIIGLWSDRAAYDVFMRDVHDSVLNQNEQQGTFAAIDVSLWTSVSQIGGSVSSTAASIASAGVIRLARCRVRPDRRAHFLEVQRTVWNPGMGASEGMLIGIFSEGSSQAPEFLVCTMWQDLEAHRRYQDGAWDGLRRRAEVEEDCVQVDGWIVRVQDEWRVRPS